MKVADDLAIDPVRGCLMRDGRPVHLRPLSYEVLKYLVENRGRLISKDELVGKIWEGRAVTDGSVAKCVEDVRIALGVEGRGFVRTVRGRGYIFDPVTAANGVRAGNSPRPPARRMIAAAVVIGAALTAAMAFRVPSPASTASPSARAPGQENSRAYQSYLNGVFYRRKGGVENVRRALDYFNHAVSEDPRFARGWAAVAQTNLDFAGNSFERPWSRISAAKDAVKKALALDNNLGEAHLTYALILRSEWNWAAADREYRLAVQRNPDVAEVHQRYSGFLSMMGRHAEALAEIRRAQQLDPLSLGFKAAEGFALAIARRGREAIPLLREAVAAEPDVASRHYVLGLAYNSAGEYASAIPEFQEALRLGGENSGTLCYLVYALAKAGRTSEARSALRQLTASEQYISPVELAAAYVGLDEYSRALELLQDGYEAHDLQMQFLKVDSHLDPLRSHPRFNELIRRVGVPD